MIRTMVVTNRTMRILGGCAFSLNLCISTPLASKVHCSINGLENSSSPEYSKVQHLFGIAVGLFSAGVGLFSATVGLRKSPPPTKKKSYSDRKKSSSGQKKSYSDRKKSYLKKVLLQQIKSYSNEKKVPLPILEISSEAQNIYSLMFY